MVESRSYRQAEASIANVHAALKKSGVSDRDIGAAMLSALLAIARNDVDHWMTAFYSAGVILARGQIDRKAN